jgi:hypothetical protein
MKASIANLPEEKKIKEEIEKFAKLTSDFFKKEPIEEQAWKSEFSQRETKITGHLFVSVFVFAISIFENPTFEQLAGLFNSILSECQIARQTVYQRVTEKAEKFFEQLLSMAIKLTIPKVLKLDLLEHFAHVILWDSTSFQLPDELAAYFRGSGGNASQSAIKIQFGYDLKLSQFFYKLQDGTSSDNSYQNNFVELFNKDDLLLRDLGYFNLRGLEELDEKGTYFLSRLHPQNGIVWTKDALDQWVPIDLLDLVHNLVEDIVELEVYIASSEHKFKARLVIERLSEPAKNQRLRKLNKDCQRKQRALTKRAMILSGFNFFIANIEKEYLPKEQFRLLYSVRWQIELIFKSWKSNFGLTKITSTKPSIVKTFLYAKLIFIFLFDKIIRITANWTWKADCKEVSFYRAYKYLKSIAYKLMLAILQDPDAVEDILLDAIKFISHSCIKSKRKGQKLPFEILEEISSNALNPLRTVLTA